MTSSEIRRRFLSFFAKRGHAIIPSASLVTPDEKGVTNSTLFNTAGMQPLIPYLLGEKHPLGNRLVSAQKCLRTIDIDDVGDSTHGTFFEMLGNWSLGDYFKEDAIKWSYEFLTDKKEGLGLDPKRLYVSVFGGNGDAPKDTEAFDIWKKYIPENRIYFLTWNGKKEPNWWEAGDDGPCGPDTEMFYDLTENGLGDMTKEEYLKADEEQKVVEVWNNVFMQYEKKEGKIIGKLKQNNVDTGAGLERLSAVLQGVNNIFDTDLFALVMDLTKNWSNLVGNQRVIADHLRAAVFLIADGVTPSNTDRGYILRRLIRRAIMKTSDKKLDTDKISRFADAVGVIYNDSYPELAPKSDLIKKTLVEEAGKFAEALIQGLKEFEKGVDAFTLFSSYGFPLELTIELAREKGIKVDIKDFEEKFKVHQQLSRAGAAQKFKGGLADASDEMIIRYHTATHLLHQALHDVLGGEVSQKGSNITVERLRFDFAHGAKLTAEEKKRVEDIVNEKIQAGLPVNKIELPRSEAEKTNARHSFDEKYGDMISVYFIGNDLNSAYSKEFCGGPHVMSTKELAGPEGKWRFKIAKEEAVAQGIRRIKAVLG
ncbi:MAG: alanine--tRNA ligase [Candidatus Paceibacterota bacterium]